MSDQELCFTPARKLAQMLRARKLSATELLKAFIGQIERVNPKVNAIVTLVPEAALAQAKKLDASSTYTDARGTRTSCASAPAFSSRR